MPSFQPSSQHLLRLVILAGFCLTSIGAQAISPPDNPPPSMPMAGHIGGEMGNADMHHMHMMMRMQGALCLYQGETYSLGAVIKVEGTNLLLTCKISEPTTPPTTTTDKPYEAMTRMPKAQWATYEGKSGR